MLNLMQNTTVIATVPEGWWVQLPDGRSLSPAIAGWTDGEFSLVAVPAPTPDEVAAEVRAERDRRLAACDWTQLADAPVNSAAWQTYRQALRDVPQQDGFPENVVWPTQPA